MTLYIAEGLNFEDYTLYHEQNETLILDNREILTFFANMDRSEINVMMECCGQIPARQTYEDYCSDIYKALTEKYGKSVAQVLSLEIKNSEHSPDEKKAENDGESIKNAVFRSIFAASKLAKGVCRVMVDFSSADTDKQMGILHSLTHIKPIRIQYQPIAAYNKKTRQVCYINTYSIDRLWDFLVLSSILLVREGRSVKQCKSCCRYFVPVSKSDEIYCISCRSISYDTKIKENEVLRLYRKIYKTQCARKKRNSQRPGIESRFDQWNRMAVKIRDECKSGNISLDEMITAISAKDWIMADDTAAEDDPK